MSLRGCADYTDETLMLSGPCSGPNRETEGSHDEISKAPPGGFISRVFFNGFRDFYLMGQTWYEIVSLTTIRYRSPRTQSQLCSIGIVSVCASQVFSGIFSALGDRDWLAQADFLFCVDAGIKDCSKFKQLGHDLFEK
jgi:hypothetical protein